MVNGRFCPEVENAPETAEGVFVMAALDRWGIWRRAGTGGLIAGMDLAEAMRGMPAGCDRGLCERLLVVAESAFCGATTRSETRKRAADGLDV